MTRTTADDSDQHTHTAHRRIAGVIIDKNTREKKRSEMKTHTRTHTYTHARSLISPNESGRALLALAYPFEKWVARIHFGALGVRSKSIVLSSISSGARNDGGECAHVDLRGDGGGQGGGGGGSRGCEGVREIL